MNATGAEPRVNSSTLFRYRAPSEAGSTTFLFAIQLQLNSLVNIDKAGLETATVFTTVTLPESSQTEIVRTIVSQRLSMEMEMRVPLLVTPNEEIQLRIEYTDNILTNPTMFPVQTSCLDCVSISFKTFVGGCEDATCLSQYKDWKTKVASDSTVPGPAQCGIPERNDLYDELYMSCFSLPEFSFISPSQYSYVEDRVEIRCEGSGELATLVEWYDSEKMLVASGSGVAVHSLLVNPDTQSFICVLDKTVESDEAVIVAEWSEECDRLFRERDSFLGEQSAECVLQSFIPGYPVGQSSYQFSQGEGPPVFAYELSLISIGENPSSMSSESAPPGQLVTQLPVRLTFDERVIQPSRRERDIIQTRIYSRDYNSVYFQPDVDTVFKLDPPVMFNLSKTLTASLVFLNLPTLDARQESQTQALLSAIACMSSRNSNCNDHFQAWSLKQKEFENAGCSSEPNYALEAYRVCQSFATTEPVIKIPPRSVEVNVTSVDNFLSTTMVCEINNAVEYNWYKVAPAPRRQFVKSGNVLPFEFIKPLDQGSYICTGKGGGPFTDSTAETKPATLTIAGRNTKSFFSFSACSINFLVEALPLSFQ